MASLLCCVAERARRTRSLATKIAVTGLLLSTVGAAPASAQNQARPPQAGSAAQTTAAQNAALQNGATSHAVPANLTAPFAPLDAKAQAQLSAMLHAWETQSKGTKTLECRFQRWHYDLFAAPAGVHATKCQGEIKYAAPDRGLFKVDQKLTFDGMKDEKPQYSEKPGQFGEHWVCNGEELLEFDHSKKECRIQQLPPEMRGKKIFESPLPFVFNLDAKQIVERYWVRQVQAPKEGMILIEAYPKRQEDRSQYKLVQIALNEKTYMPEALLMYAPNFNIKTAPRWDHYEFVDVKRNSISQGLFDRFMKNFIDEKPPSDWKVFQNSYQPQEPKQMASQGDAENSLY
ncbi:TIGR03009 domain-containing protein [Allorhodopirellula solitaria]|nr:TIGR03009 domain-containing protein [Allorhodopirellula solitaria]